jgi:hypothetical protein
VICTEENSSAEIVRDKSECALVKLPDVKTLVRYSNMCIVVCNNKDGKNSTADYWIF